MHPHHQSSHARRASGSTRVAIVIQSVEAPRMNDKAEAQDTAFFKAHSCSEDTESGEGRPLSRMHIETPGSNDDRPATRCAILAPCATFLIGIPASPAIEANKLARAVGILALRLAASREKRCQSRRASDKISNCHAVMDTVSK